VGGVGVTDPDEGDNWNTELHVVNSSGPFVVDNTQGTLRTTNNLDREADDRYDLYLLASDRGHPLALTSAARVTIFVEDINDNQPKVVLPSSNSSCQPVSRATIAGTLVTKVYAIDEDSGLNSEITYTVVAPPSVQSSSPFWLDSRSGNITVAQQLLQKDLGMHHMLIVVRDGGNPLHFTPLSGSICWWMRAGREEGGGRERRELRPKAHLDRDVGLGSNPPKSPRL